MKTFYKKISFCIFSVLLCISRMPKVSSKRCLRTKWNAAEMVSQAAIHAVSKLQWGRGVLRLSVSPFSGFLNWCLFILFIYFGHTLQHAGSLFLDQGLNPGPLCWEQGVLTTGHQGSPSDFLFLKDQVSRPRWSRYTSLYSSYKVQIETLELTCNFIYNKEPRHVLYCYFYCVKKSILVNMSICFVLCHKFILMRIHYI